MRVDPRRRHRNPRRRGVECGRLAWITGGEAVLSAGFQAPGLST